MNDIKMSKKLNTLSNDKRIVELLMDTKTAERTPLIAVVKEHPQPIVARLFYYPSVEQAQKSRELPS